MLILFNKPYGVISQFSRHEKYPTLKDFIPYKNVYPAGRLDTDSEGLLILTDNGAFQNKISNPENKILKTYMAQVENIPNNSSLEKLKYLSNDKFFVDIISSGLFFLDNINLENFSIPINLELNVNFVYCNIRK